MIASLHLACGAAGGVFVQKYLPSKFDYLSRYLSAFVVGFISHIILDAWPHWEYTQGGSKLLSILLIESVFVFVGIFSSKRSLMMNLILFTGMVGGAVPDLVLMIWGKLLFWQPLLYFHFVTHIFHSSLPVFGVGWLFQVILAILAIIYVRDKSV